ncbi:MAG: hypothetical protein QM820_45335 [Minicystis sp.]
MNRSRRWLLGAAVSTALGAWMLVHPHEQAGSRPAGSAAAAAPSGRIGESSPGSPPSAAAWPEIHEEVDRSPDARRSSYLRAFNGRIERRMRRVALRCADPDFVSSMRHDFDEVRDRIVESAVAAEQGLGPIKTKAEESLFEQREMAAFEARRCQEIEERSLSADCKRLFPRCDGALAARR